METDYFGPFVSLTKAHARKAVEAYRQTSQGPTSFRETPQAPITEVWLLWGGVHMVLGVYATQEAAERDLAKVRAINGEGWIDHRVVG